MDNITGMQFIKFMAEYRGMKDLGRAEEIINRLLDYMSFLLLQTYVMTSK